jgi:hypothetical protein
VLSSSLELKVDVVAKVLDKYINIFKKSLLGYKFDKKF